MLIEFSDETARLSLTSPREIEVRRIIGTFAHDPYIVQSN